MRISNDRLFLLVADRGYTTISSLIRKEYPTFATHGSYSWMLNFLALGQLFLALGGFYWLSPTKSGLKFGAFCTDKLSKQNLPETTMTLRQELDDFGPYQVFGMKEMIIKNQDNIDLKDLLSYLELSHWDPRILLECLGSLLDRKESFTTEEKNRFVYGLKQATLNFYPIPHVGDGYSELARLSFALKLYHQALVCYNQSLEFYGYRPNIHYNIGLCLIMLKEPDKAQGTFKLVSKMDSENKNVVEWLEILNTISDLDYDSLEKDRVHLFQLQQF
jgi:tetratricopeptide (TPR) repeat protein